MGNPLSTTGQIMSIDPNMTYSNVDRQTHKSRGGEIKIYTLLAKVNVRREERNITIL